MENFILVQLRVGLQLNKHSTLKLKVLTYVTVL